VVPGLVQRAPRGASVQAGPRPPESDMTATARSDALERGPERPVDDVPAGDRDAAPPREPVRSEIGLATAASICTGLAQAETRAALATVVECAARSIDAVGLVLWVWEPGATVITPWLAHGYSDAMTANMPSVPLDAGNAIAEACRSAQARVVRGGHNVTGALVVPLVAPGGCVGVLAVELKDGGEESESVHAFVSLLAAQLATWLRAARPVDVITV